MYLGEDRDRVGGRIGLREGDFNYGWKNIYNYYTAILMHFPRSTARNNQEEKVPPSTMGTFQSL